MHCLRISPNSTLFYGLEIILCAWHTIGSNSRHYLVSQTLGAPRARHNPIQVSLSPGKLQLCNSVVSTATHAQWGERLNCNVSIELGFLYQRLQSQMIFKGNYRVGCIVRHVFFWHFRTAEIEVKRRLRSCLDRMF
jgi:hypothetical protein